MEIFDCEGASQEEGHSAATVPVTISSHSSKAKTRNGDERNPDTQVFIRSFEFNPDLPIRIDYEAKGFKTDMVCHEGMHDNVSFVDNALWLIVIGREQSLDSC